MNQDADQSNVEALLQRQEVRRRWLQEAGRPHTKNLFGLWLLLVSLACTAIAASVVREEFSDWVPISIFFIALVTLTGAYVFQEVARVHRRIDALLKLFEEDERTRARTTQSSH